MFLLGIDTATASTTVAVSDGRQVLAEANVVPGIVNNTFILIVKGKKPYLNMRVLLAPLIYARQPEYWGIEVIGCLDRLGTRGDLAKAVICRF